MFTAFSPQIHSAEGFGPPALGGVVNTMFKAFAFNTTGVAAGATLFNLPYGAEIIGYVLNISTAFDGSVANTIDFGTTGALTTFAAAIDASATGQLMNGFVPAAMFTRLSEDTPFIVRYNGTTPTAGAATIAVLYITRGTT